MSVAVAKMSVPRLQGCELGSGCHDLGWGGGEAEEPWNPWLGWYPEVLGESW